MKRQIYKKMLLLVVYLMAVSCDQDKLPLPSPKIKTTGFGANDTSYVELNPTWDNSFLGLNLSHPTDITIGPDGYLFVADEGNDRVVVLNKSGSQIKDHGLGQITGIEHPSGLCVDRKLNLFIVNGSNTLYYWNQYLNYVQIDSVAEKVVVFDKTINDTLHFNIKEAYLMNPGDTENVEFRKFLFTKDPQLIEKAKALAPIHVNDDINASYNGVAAYENDIYVTDTNLQSINKISLVPEFVVKTTDKTMILKYSGIFAGKVVNFGSGAGTVDQPWGITTDEFGNLYFTQLGGNFKVQKLDGEFYTSQYTLYVNPIMDLNLFDKPYDVALDNSGDIFVMDTGASKLYKFFNKGSKAGRVADLGDKGVAIAEFNDARGIVFSENVIYIVESGENRIRRFEYSISDEDLPDDDKKP